MALTFNDLENQMKQIISVPPQSLKKGANIRVVGDIASRDAIAAFEGLKVFVLDASADETVGSGGSSYIYTGTAWVKTSEAESMDLVVYTQDEIDTLIADYSPTTEIETMLESYDTSEEVGAKIDSYLASSFDAKLKKIVFDSPLLGTADAVLTSTVLAETDPTVVTEGITDPDVPRVLSITGNAGTVTGDVVISGLDALDNEITDTITTNGTNTVNGTKAFKTVTSITLPARGAESDEISVGTTSSLGINRVVSVGIPIYASVGGTSEGTLPEINTAVNLEENLITFDTALDGSSVFLCYYIEE